MSVRLVFYGGMWELGLRVDSTTFQVGKLHVKTSLPSNLMQDHPRMRARKHHGSMSDRTGVIADRSFTLQE